MGPILWGIVKSRLWGIVKSRLYAIKDTIHSDDELQLALTGIWNSLTLTELGNICNCYRRKLEECIESDGEHILKI